MKKKEKTANAHQELGDLDVNVTSFGEIDGKLDIDKINAFLDRNVTDKKLEPDQIKKAKKK